MVGADSVPKKFGSNEQILTFTGYQYYSSPVCQISAKNLIYLKIVQRVNDILKGYYFNNFGNATPTIFLNINTKGTYKINLSTMPTDAVYVSIYYAGNPDKQKFIDFDVICEYS